MRIPTVTQGVIISILTAFSLLLSGWVWNGLDHRFSQHEEAFKAERITEENQSKAFSELSVVTIAFYTRVETELTYIHKALDELRAKK